MSSEKMSIGSRLWRICEHKLLNIFLLLALFLFSFLSPIFYISDSDIWHNLKAGEIIWQNKEILKKDIFSYTCEGKEWINNEWLHQVTSYLLYSLGSSIFGSHSDKSFAFLIIWQGVLLLLLSFIMIALLLRRSISLPVAVFCALIPLLLLQNRLNFRSEIYSFLFIAFYLWLFDRFRQKDFVLNEVRELVPNKVRESNIIFLLPFLQWIWLSMHGGFIMGWLITALFLLSELIAKAVYSQKSGVRSQELRVRYSVFGVRNSKLETQIPQSPISNSQPDVSNLQSKIPDSQFNIQNSEFGVRSSESEIRNSQFAIRNLSSTLRNLQSAIRNYISPPISNSQLKKLALAFFLALILPLLNPFFYKAYLLPFQVQFGEEFRIMRTFLKEWLPSSNSVVSGFHIYISIVILSLTGFVLQREKRNMFYYLLFFFVLPMPYISIRHLAIFSVSSILPLALGIQSISQRLAPSFKKDWQKRGISLLFSIIVLLYLTWLIQERVKPHTICPFGIGVDESWLPSKACDFLKQTDIKGPMLNMWRSGYLLWRLYPEYKTFADGRNVMLKNEILEKREIIENAKPGWENLLLQYNVNFLILPFSPFPPKTFLSALDTSPNWCLIYFDDISVIYLRKTKTNFNLIERYDYKGIKLSDTNFSYIKNIASLNIATANLKRKTLEDPSCVIAHNFLATLLERKGEIGKAEEEYRLACKYTKIDIDSFVNLSAFYLRYGKVEPALIEALKVYKKAPDLPVVYSLLGECYLVKKQSKKAKIYFRKAFKSSIDKAPMLTNIGVCYAQEENLEKAEEKFKSALALNPHYLPARLNLAKCYLDKKLWKKAEEEYESVLAIDYSNLRAHLGLSIAYKKQLKLDAAELELKKCLKIFPKSAESFYNLARIKALQEKQKDAIKFLKQSIKLGGKIFAEQASQDFDFVSIRGNKEFRLLTE